MDLKKIRACIIQAIGSDDTLMELLVLKGGNALDIVYELNSRTSVDIDFSLGGDFEDPSQINSRLCNALTQRFSTERYVVFDYKFEARPKRGPSGERWGGYQAEFKLISEAVYNTLQGNAQDIRNAALSVGDPSSTRKFTIQISKFEWVSGAMKMDLDGIEFLVYTLPMIAAEKFRAICQQMDGYAHTAHPRPRARDFLDIFTIVQNRALRFEDLVNRELVAAIFEAKEVPLSYLGRIKDTYDFHAQDWASVQTTAPGSLEPFDYYFQFAVKQAEKLKPLWEK